MHFVKTVVLSVLSLTAAAQAAGFSCCNDFNGGVASSCGQPSAAPRDCAGQIAVHCETWSNTPQGYSGENCRSN
ncbi:hypothetical protein FQN54_002239 [Arachnomyces sp. PD_36]|nr:hypothetical protein FQN54_002239 [Arachnomyces sp. PD_36]